MYFSRLRFSVTHREKNAIILPKNSMDFFNQHGSILEGMFPA